MKRWVIALVSGLVAISVRAEFQRVTLNYEGKELVGSVRTLNPLTVEFSDFREGVFTRMLWVDQGEGFQQVYSNQADLIGVEGDAGDFDIVGNNLGDVFLVNRLKTDLGNRGEGVIFRLGDNGFEEIAPRATERLGQGATGKFSYGFPQVAGNGTVAMIGYDDRFPHFVLRVVGSEVQVIAQESVTPVPNGGGAFSRFGADLQISEDGSRIAFRGERIDGQSGLYLWTESGTTTVADSSMTIPGRSENFNGFFDQSISSFMGNDGAVYFLNLSPGALMVYRDGNLETLLSDGDIVDGDPVAQLFNVQQGPNGDLFAQDNRGFLHYRAGVWETYQVLGNFETPDGKRLSGAYRVGDDGVYFNGSVFIREELRSEASLYRRAFDSDELVKVLDFDAAAFGDASGGVPQIILADQVLFRNQTGEYVGSRADLIRDLVGEQGPAEPPAPGLSGFEAALATLPAPVRGALMDADGDGISNLVEYIFGLPLTVASSLSTVFQGTVQLGEDLGLVGDNNRYFSVEVRVRSHLDNITFRVVMADSLEQLSNGGLEAVEVGLAVSEGDFERKVFRSPVGIEVSPIGFIGLVAEWTP